MRTTSPPCNQVWTPRTIRRFAAGIAAGAGASAIVLGYACLLEPGRIKVEQWICRVRRLDPQLDGFIVAQMTDLHCGSRRRWLDHLRRAVELVNASNPDLVALTGDMVTETPHVVECARALQGLRARFGVVAVLGNHDFYGPPTRHLSVSHALSSAGITVLDNDVYEVAGPPPLLVIGLNDAYTGHDKVTAVPRKLSVVSGARIVLSHYPDIVEWLAPGTADLVLSGHAHGGQVGIPGLSQAVARFHAHSRYAGGPYVVDGTPLYVSRGLGTGVPGGRLLSPPEITLIRLARG